jgi:hypothetical protein
LKPYEPVSRLRNNNDKDRDTRQDENCKPPSGKDNTYHGSGSRPSTRSQGYDPNLPIPVTPATRKGQEINLPYIPPAYTPNERFSRLPNIKTAPAFSSTPSEFSDWAFSIQRYARNRWQDQPERVIINLVGDKLPATLLPQ